MGKKKRFRWKDKTERSIAELITEDGPLRAEAIYPIIRRLCQRLTGPEELSGRQLICPASVLVDQYGEVRLIAREATPAELAVYLPPEQNRAELNGQSEKVYALGMLMLYMATGQEKKGEAEISLGDARLLSLIRRAAAFDPMERFEDLASLHNAVRREMRLGRRVAPVLLILLTAAALAALIFAAWRTGGVNGAKAGDAAGYRPGYAEGYDRGFSAAPGMVVNAASVDSHSGSLSGNYAVGEGPTAAYSEKDVFFLLNGDILRMDAATGRTALLKKGSGAVSLQYYQGALYCCTPEKILRLDPETKKEEIFCERGGRLFIFEDVFYLWDSADTRYLYRIEKDGKSLTQISGAAEYRSLNVVEDKLYFIDPDKGGGICCIDPRGDETSLISSNPYESFCIYAGKLYAGTDYGLLRMELNGGSPEILTGLPASSPNASDGGIFYIAGSGRTLEWMSLDGRTRFTVVSTPTSSFQVAGKWIFYQNEDDGGRLWKVRVSGADKGRAAEY